ncbi:hypothetical protein Lal_00037927 [Lupinus albus]|nr:hypothetical protein Lal_00041885 [Lupinus albus]KAF1895811.1 hypothetical protein Lal_00037927 [Lupinus albus]
MERNERLLLRFAAETTPELLRLGVILNRENDEIPTLVPFLLFRREWMHTPTEDAMGLSVDLP